MVRKTFALGAMSLIMTGQIFPLAVFAQSENSGLPPAILGEISGDKGGEKPAPTVTPPAGETSSTSSVKVEPQPEPVVRPESGESHPQTSHASPKTFGGLKEEVAKTAAPAAAVPKKPVLLFGRLEEISGRATPTFPIVLKALTPKMDNSGLLKGQATAGTLAGTVVRSYPADFRGTWGGNLTLAQMQIAPLNYQLDPDDATKSARILRNGSVGTANFTFATDARGNITAEPTQIAFMVPANLTNAYEQMGAQTGGQGMGNAAMAGMMKQMMGNMKVPVVIKFGNFQSSAAVTGVSGNQFSIGVLSNRLRQLSPGIMEQQIITQENIRVARTGKQYSTYNENVFRYTERGSTQMYVEVASVSYDMSRRFLRKMVFYGYVNKGAVQPDPTNPNTMMQQMMGGGAGGMQFPGMGGLGGAGGANPLQQLQDLQKMFGGQ